MIPKVARSKPARKTTRRNIATAKKDKAACDRIFSQLVRSVGVCRRCGKGGRLECAHIISRELSAIRCDLRNAWALCHACHMRLTQYPHEHMQFVTETIGLDVHRELCDKAHAYGKGVLKGAAFWKAERARLEELVRRAG